MQHYNQGYDELYHVGVYGMKWGQRRYVKDQDRRIKTERRLNKNNPDHKSFKEKTNREKMKEAHSKIKEEERSFTMKQRDDRIKDSRIDYQVQRRNMNQAWDDYKKQDLKQVVKFLRNMQMIIISMPLVDLGQLEVRQLYTL